MPELCAMRDAPPILVSVMARVRCSYLDDLGAEPELGPTLVRSMSIAYNFKIMTWHDCLLQPVVTQPNSWSPSIRLENSHSRTVVFAELESGCAGITSSWGAAIRPTHLQRRKAAAPGVSCRLLCV